MRYTTKYKIMTCWKGTLKAVPLLTISNEYRLKQELLGYKRKSEELQVIRQQLSENYEQKMQSFKEEMKREIKKTSTKSLNPDMQKQFGNIKQDVRELIKETLNEMEPEKLRKLFEFPPFN